MQITSYRYTVSRYRILHRIDQFNNTLINLQPGEKKWLSLCSLYLLFARIHCL